MVLIPALRHSSRNGASFCLCDSATFVQLHNMTLYTNFDLQFLRLLNDCISSFIYFVFFCEQAQQHTVLVHVCHHDGAHICYCFRNSTALRFIYSSSYVPDFVSASRLSTIPTPNLIRHAMFSQTKPPRLVD